MRVFQPIFCFDSFSLPHAWLSYKSCVRRHKWSSTVICFNSLKTQTQVIDLLGQSDADTARATLVDQLAVMNDTLDHLLDGSDPPPCHKEKKWKLRQPLFASIQTALIMLLAAQVFIHWYKRMAGAIEKSSQNLKRWTLALHRWASDVHTPTPVSCFNQQINFLISSAKGTTCTKPSFMRTFAVQSPFVHVHVQNMYMYVCVYVCTRDIWCL